MGTTLDPTINTGRRLAGAIALALALSATACSSVPRRDAAAEAPATVDRSQLLLQARHALEQGQGTRAQALAEGLLARDMRDPGHHLLLAAAHQIQDEASLLDVAGSGLEAAARLGDSGPWPAYLAGINAMREQRHAAAQEAFARAVMAAPDAAWAYEGLAAASYMTGDLALARASATRASALEPQAIGAWRTSVLAAAGADDAPAVARLVASAPLAMPSSQREQVVQRADALLRTAAVDATTPGGIDGGDAFAGDAAPAPQQLTVDVTLILGDLRRSRSRGVNLLESLQVQFGKSHQRQRVSDVSGTAESTSITRLIRIPDITYNLNILNRGQRNYEVIARPSLSAFLGEQSTFFVGEQLNVALSGVQFAQLDKINVGVGLKITPAEIRQDGARFRVEADRSFFSDQGVGSFSQQLATFQQNVAATADVRFGETLVLSGLSESVSDGNESGVPVLGDIPVLDMAFNRKTDQRRQRSVIILVTPSRPLGLATSERRGDAVQKLMRLWDTLVEPNHGIAATADRFQQSRFFSRASVSDVGVRDLHDPQLRHAFLAALPQPVASAAMPDAAAR